jgi:hypothetical protein
MRHLRFALLAVLALAGAISYQGQAHAICQGPVSELDVIGYESITVSSTAIGFTAATFAPSGGQPAIYAYATTETNSIRFRADGIAPTATEGHLVAAPGAFEVCGLRAITNLSMIRASADATVKATYYRRRQ